MTAKAKFSGPLCPVVELPPGLSGELQAYALQHCARDKDPSKFADLLSMHTTYAAAAIQLYKAGGTNKNERGLELSSLKASLADSERKLLMLSFETHILFESPDESDPVAETRRSLQLMMRQVDAALQTLKQQPRAPRPDERVREVASELAEDFAETLEHFGAPVSRTSDADFDGSSPAVELLERLGSIAGIRLSKRTWRDYLSRRSKRPVGG